MFSLAHLSDLHSTPVEVRGPTEVMNQRVLGWLSWQLHRRRIHRAEVVHALVEDLHDRAPDHVVVTGDLTNIGLESEFEAGRRWLERLGAPDAVTAVPGNHDAYVDSPESRSWAPWAEYMRADAALGDVTFPFVRTRGPVALGGVASSIPTPPTWANGRVGEAQLERLEAMLRELGDAGWCRTVLVHHPPQRSGASRRRALDDAEALCGVLARVGAELVLHGHCHRTMIGQIPGPRGPIPVAGVRSASDFGSQRGKRARYHLIEVDERVPVDGAVRFSLRLRAREWDGASGSFREAGEAHDLA